MEEEKLELVSQHSGKGNVVIEPLDFDGKFISVKNVTDDALNIGGWTLANSTGGQEVLYKFHRSTTLQPNETCTVWSSDTQQVSQNATNAARIARGAMRLADLMTQMLLYSANVGTRTTAKFGNEARWLVHWGREYYSLG